MLRTILFLAAILAATNALASDTSKYTPDGSRVVMAKIFKKVDPSRVYVVDTEINERAAVNFIAAIHDAARAPSKPFFVVIRSPGGSISDGMQMIGAIRALKAQTGLKTTCIVDGMAASMAAIVMSYCNETYATAYSLILFHQAAYTLRGNASMVDADQRFIKAYILEIETDLARQLGMPLVTYLQARSSALELTGREAAQIGLINGIVDLFAVPPKKPDNNPLQFFFNMFRLHIGGTADAKETK